MSDAPIANVVRADHCIVQLADDLQLVVSEVASTKQFVAVINQGSHPFGKTLVTSAFHLSEARIHQLSNRQPEGIWMGSALFKLPWLDLLKVADYLQLPIPLPESGEAA